MFSLRRRGARDRILGRRHVVLWRMGGVRPGGLRRLRKGLGLLALLAVLSPVAAAAAPLAYLGASVFDPVSLSVAASIPLRIQAVHPAGTLAYGFVVPPA